MRFSLSYSPPVKIFYWFRKHLKNPKMGTLYCRLVDDGRRLEISTEIEIGSRSWNRNRKVATGEENAWINEQLERMSQAIRTIEKSVPGRGLLKLQAIRERLVNPTREEKEPPKDLNWLFRNYFEVKFGPGTRMELSTQKSIRAKIEKCKAFVKERDLERLPVTEFRTNHAREFYAWVMAKGHEHNSAVKYCVYFKEAFKFAIEAGIITLNPFSRLSLSEVSTKRDFLTLSQLELLRKATLKAEIRKAVDQFLLMAYTGMNVSDLPKLRSEDFYEDQGRLWLTYTRKKSQTNRTALIANTPIFPEVLEILKRYDGKAPVNWGQSINRNLKVAQQQLGITVSLTTKVARKSCADMLINEMGLSLDVVAAILGNTVRTLTQNYANVRQKRIANELKVVLG